MILARTEWRQVGGITAGAVAIFAALRLLPTGTNLSHMDFRVDPKAGNAIVFCDPLNPLFIPVVAARSPVTLSVATAEPPVAGRAATTGMNCGFSGSQNSIALPAFGSTRKSM